MVSRGLGRVPFVDPRNYDNLLDDKNPGLKARALPGALTQRKWCLRKWVDQGATARCSAFALTHELSAAPIYHQRLPLGPQALYDIIQETDRAAGRNFGPDGGATTNAMADVAVKLGLWGGYDWDYQGDAALGFLARNAPIISGTNWYTSMYDRDTEGIIHIMPRARVDGGHLFTINGYDPSKGDGLLRIAQTWGDGYYYLTIPDWYRLISEDGEIVIPRELPF